MMQFHTFISYFEDSWNQKSVWDRILAIMLIVLGVNSIDTCKNLANLYYCVESVIHSFILIMRIVSLVC